MKFAPKLDVNLGRHEKFLFAMGKINEQCVQKKYSDEYWISVMQNDAFGF